MLDRRSLLSLAAAAPTLALAPRSAQAQALAGWKLQIPGPKEIKDLAGYQSRFFRQNADGSLQFWIDAAMDGSTKNSQYVRSELRHLADWPHRAPLARRLSARIAVQSSTRPDRVTVMQIHSPDAPPLVRIALESGMPVAWIKTDPAGKKTDKVTLGGVVGSAAFDCALVMQNSQLQVSLNGQSVVTRDLSFWPHACYFKAGLYPQAHAGEVSARFERLQVSV